MTNPMKTHSHRGVAVATPSNWLVPPIIVPLLLTIMIALRAIYLAYPW
jgi:hypothetical protein